MLRAQRALLRPFRCSCWGTRASSVALGLSAALPHRAPGRTLGRGQHLGDAIGSYRGLQTVGTAQPLRSTTSKGVPLPEGWLEHLSARGPYYQHVPTGATQWDLPTGQPAPSKEALNAYREKYEEQISKLQLGATVELRGIVSAPGLNGKVGVCEGWDHASGMVRVRLAGDGGVKAVKPEFLVARLTHSSRADSGARAAGHRQHSVRAPHQPAPREVHTSRMKHVKAALGGSALFALWIYSVTVRESPPERVVHAPPLQGDVG
mmetsp:Transcript_91149/g.258118  ORF Transcript_91149/g.258118 Transcript_91149/m.258118 type:complete len:263 (+) Transcript_91149:47-835(+)|eukprot:CAMPEP_0179260490 /NCGR_PEP_ID=MMETSP0797-20121207/26366_1 /TAXON_ID=47934 /ORGANISM="Dinophysis acuminata, Strain DAEP01" /LENGTH=262 /DNA_ID=CAMNT_0020968571 /DNA_START=45 /DNA_END=833 /DNA_ORIENTATION=+